MLKKRSFFLIVIMSIILVVGYLITFPKWIFPNVYPTFVETIDSNWYVNLPTPVREVEIYNARGGSHGDGESITELHYANSLAIEKIKALSSGWISGEEFEVESFPKSIRSLINEIDKEANYFFLQESDFDYLIIKCKGNKITLFESYT